MNSGSLMPYLPLAQRARHSCLGEYTDVTHDTEIECYGMLSLAAAMVCERIFIRSRCGVVALSAATKDGGERAECDEEIHVREVLMQVSATLNLWPCRFDPLLIGHVRKEGIAQNHGALENTTNETELASNFLDRACNSAPISNVTAVDLDFNALLFKLAD
ncbi:hypothetical protein CC80DRAFT_550303 [Byssothecium circinans]|uniref:Uncharacterized protein n=1 Tax=Byssothecium circinans TaxID=147558 RepID=A0A6A5TZA2_9PLEO|nr:hypothetical protein CC80DRAFT_550303 [Byssothecium circinans]